MISDRTRTSPYVEALRRAVRPDTVVLDIGTGTGIFALLACRFGAARVYAIESDDAIEVAKRCAANIPDSDRIAWLQGLSTDIVLPERVDVVIADLHGVLPLYDAGVASLIDARERHLKPNGQMIPARDVMRVVPAQAPHEYAYVRLPWEQNDYGIDLLVAREFMVNSWWHARTEPAAPENLLSSPCTWGTIDYTRTESPNLDGELEWRIERPGMLHGLYVWFDGDVADGLGFSNAPQLPELVFGRAFFPLMQAIDVVSGDRVRTRMSAALVDGAYVFRWDTHITDGAGTVRGNFKQSTFHATPHNLHNLQRGAADYVPTLNLDGRIDHAAMEAMAQNQPLGAIASALAARFPQRFADMPAALNHVAKLSAIYTRSDEPTAGPGWDRKSSDGSDSSP